MQLEKEIKNFLQQEGVQLVSFINITGLPSSQNKGYSSAVLLGIALSTAYLNKVISTPNYVENMIKQNLVDEDEFNLIEKKTDNLADGLADFLKEKGIPAYSQSEKNVMMSGFYDEEKKSTPLPHKTIALMAGLGWIGRNNLLVNPGFGSAISLCSVLTDAPLNVILRTPLESRCGTCNVCKNICKPMALKGADWSFNTHREALVDVFKCTTCLKCLAFCPYTRSYARKGMLEGA